MSSEAAQTFKFEAETRQPGKADQQANHSRNAPGIRVGTGALTCHSPREPHFLQRGRHD